jgi:Tol biopolymer transport system component
MTRLTGMIAAALCVGLVACSSASPPPSGTPPTIASSVPSASASAQASLSPSATSGPAPGGQIAFVRDQELMLLDIASGAETATGITGVSPLAFTADQASLIGVRVIPDNPHAVSLVRQPTDGEEATVLVDELPFDSPSPSPDGRWLLFGSSGVPPGGIVLVDLESGEAHQLTTDGGWGGVWSPDGTRIAYVRQADSEGQDLFVIDVATGATQQLTNDEWEDEPLRWTEDGSAVLTTSHRGGDGSRMSITVWQIEALSGQLTERPDLDTAVTSSDLLSPDGRWRARISPQYILSITEPDRGAGNRLGPADTGTHMTWSPNSAWLVWTAWEGPESADLYMVHAPDGEPIRLTRTPEMESHPVWGPIRHGF